MESNQLRDAQTDWEQKLSLVVRYETQKNLFKPGQKKQPSFEQYCYVIVGVLTRYATLGLMDAKYRTDDINTLELIKVFNPITWVWESPKYIFKLALSSAIGVYGPAEFTKLINFAYNALLTADDVIYVPESYSGARYLLFDNGIFDAKAKDLITVQPDSMHYRINDEQIDVPVIRHKPLLEIDGQSVPLPEVGFTEKHKHHCSYYKNPELPRYAPEDPEQYNDWNPLDWLVATAGGDPEQAHYILEIMGTMLVPQHQFNAFIEINGASGSGKTTIINLVKAIYGNRTTMLTDYTVETLSENFPFRGTVNKSTGVVHITEINGATIGKRVIPLVNQFANEGVSLKQLGNVDIFLSPPPLLVMEGAGWAHFDITNTGMQRRILPLDISNSFAQSYKAKQKKSVFHQRKVLEWIASKAVQAFADMTHGDDHFIYQLEDIDKLPRFLQRWHAQAISAGDRFMNNYMARIKPALHTGYLPVQIMYDLYKESTKIDAMDPNFQRKIKSFSVALIIYLKQLDFEVVDLDDTDDGLQQHSSDELGIDFEVVNEAMPLPESCSNYDSTFARFKRPNWLKITDKTKLI